MSLTQKYALAFKLIDNPSTMTMTSSFRSTSRDKKPSYASRYVRDFNDLNYDLPSSFSPSKKHKNSPNKTKFNKKNNNPEKQTKMYEISPPKDRQLMHSSGIEANNYKVKDLFRQTGITIDTQNSKSAFQNPIKAHSLKILRNKKTDYGLSKFELEKTIIGRIQKRYSHHIKFDKSPPRQENINKIWYSREVQYDSPDRLVKGKDIQKKIHPFKSDSPHKVFTPKDTLPHFYELQKGQKLVKQRSDINVRQMQKFTNRLQLQKKPGTHLQYQKNRSLQNNKKPLFKISTIDRKLSFSRQVISPERGCYR